MAETIILYHLGSMKHLQSLMRSKSLTTELGTGVPPVIIGQLLTAPMVLFIKARQSPNTMVSLDPSVPQINILLLTSPTMTSHPRSKSPLPLLTVFSTSRQRLQNSPRAASLSFSMQLLWRSKSLLQPLKISAFLDWLIGTVSTKEPINCFHHEDNLEHQPNCKIMVQFHCQHYMQYMPSLGLTNLQRHSMTSSCFSIHPFS